MNGAYEIFKDLAIILISAKLCGLLAGKLKAPQVVGEIIAGLLIGPCMLGLVQDNNIDQRSGRDRCCSAYVFCRSSDQSEGSDAYRLESLSDCLSSGVLVPLLGGYLLYSCYYGFAPGGSSGSSLCDLYRSDPDSHLCKYYGCHLEGAGDPETETGTTIMSAAIIDDVIGIIVLTFVIGMNIDRSLPR